MNETPQTPVPNTVDLPVEKITTLNLDDIKPNTILVFNLNVDTPEEKMFATPSLAKLLAPFTSILKEKKVSIMVMSKNETIEQVDEADMNRAGWFKKEKSLIINPYQK